MRISICLNAETHYRLVRVMRTGELLLRANPDGTYSPYVPSDEDEYGYGDIEFVTLKNDSHKEGAD